MMIKKRKQQRFRVLSLMKKMYNLLEKHNLLDDDVKKEYDDIINDYHFSILRELDDSMLKRSMESRKEYESDCDGETEIVSPDSNNV